jgi:hypothetical protein
VQEQVDILEEVLVVGLDIEIALEQVVVAHVGEVEQELVEPFVEVVVRS